MLKHGEYAKCMDLKHAVDKVAEKLSMIVTFSCVNGTSAEDCTMKIKAGSADLVTLDGGDIKTAGITFTAKACQLSEAVHVDIATRQSIFKQNSYRICLIKEVTYFDYGTRFPGTLYVSTHFIVYGLIRCLSFL